MEVEGAEWECAYRLRPTHLFDPVRREPQDGPLQTHPEERAKSKATDGLLEVGEWKREKEVWTSLVDVDKEKRIHLCNQPPPPQSSNPNKTRTPACTRSLSPPPPPPPPTPPPPPPPPHPQPLPHPPPPTPTPNPNPKP